MSQITCNTEGRGRWFETTEQRQTRRRTRTASHTNTASKPRLPTPKTNAQDGSGCRRSHILSRKPQRRASQRTVLGRLHRVSCLARYERRLCFPFCHVREEDTMLELLRHGFSSAILACKWPHAQHAVLSFPPLVI